MCHVLYTHYLDGKKEWSWVVLFSFITPLRDFYVYFMPIHGWQDFFQWFNVIWSMSLKYYPIFPLTYFSNFQLVCLGILLTEKKKRIGLGIINTSNEIALLISNVILRALNTHISWTWLLNFWLLYGTQFWVLVIKGMWETPFFIVVMVPFRNWEIHECSFLRGG